MPPRARECEICNVTYRPTYNKQRTCGRDCGWKLKVREGKVPTRRVPTAVAATCHQCGSQFSYMMAGGMVRSFCSEVCIDTFDAAFAEAWAEARRKQCPGCNVRFMPSHGNQGYCTRACARRVSKSRDVHRNHRKRARHHGVHYEPVKRAYIFERDGWRCGICRKAINKKLAYPHPMSASIDHVLPMACGGAHEAANLRAAHWICNSLKSDGGTEQGEQLMLIG